MDDIKKEGDIVMISLKTKKLSDELHVRQQRRIEELEHENAWLKIQLRKIQSECERDIEVSHGAVVLW